MRPEPFSCERDGLVIRGKAYGPKDGPSPMPAAILCHGFLANLRMCAAYARLLANMGYATFTFDFCGGGLRCSSDGRSEDMTVLTEKADLVAVFDHVRGPALVDAARVSLLGCSQGGLVSAMVARERPHDVSRLLLLYPALCIPDDARGSQGLWLRYHGQDHARTYNRSSRKDATTARTIRTALGFHSARPRLWCGTRRPRSVVVKMEKDGRRPTIGERVFGDGRETVVRPSCVTPARRSGRPPRRWPPRANLKM